MNVFRSATTLRIQTIRARQLKKRETSELGRNVYLFSFPRGGSTLLAEAVSRSFGNAPIAWEPFFKRRMEFRKYPHKKLWGWREFIPADASRSTIDNYFSELIDRTYLPARLFTGQSIKCLDVKNPMIFKFCYANLMAPYLISRFDLSPIFLDRHPAQIIASRKVYGGFDHDGGVYPVGPNQSVNSNELLDYYTGERGNAIRTWAGVNAWDYCVARMVIDSFRSNKNFLYVDYNDLVVRPEMCAIRVSDFLQCDVSPDLFQIKSRTAVGDISRRSQTEKWKSILSTEEIEEIENIVCGIFQMDIWF